MSRTPNRLPFYTFGEGEEFEENLQIIDLVNDGTNLPIVNLKATPVSANTGVVMQLESDGANWSTGATTLKLVSDDDDAIPLRIYSGTSQRAYINRNGLLYLQDDIQFGSSSSSTIATTAGISLKLIPGAGAITIIGNAGSTSHSLNANDDLYVSGKLEVDGVTYLDGSLEMGGAISLSSFTITASSGSTDGAIQIKNTIQTPDSTMFNTGSTSNGIIICEYDDRGFDFSHAQQTNPTLFIHSANQSTTEWSSITHDQTNAVISTGEGMIIKHSATSGITASTTQTQGQQPLTTNVNEVSTCGNANDVVTLPSAVAGADVIIINNGAQTLQIFPASGDDLGSGVNSSTTLAAGSNVHFVAYDATNWETI